MPHHPWPAEVHEDWFADPTLRRAWQWLQQAQTRGDPVDVAALVGHLGPEAGELIAHQDLTIQGWLTIPSAVEALRAWYCRDVAAALLRQLPGRVRDDPEAALTWAAEAARQAVDRARPAVGTSAHALLTALYEALEARDAPGFPWGVPTLDGLTGGVHPGELIVIGARPKTGKTQWALNLTHTWLQAGRRVLYFSFEMLAQEVGVRLLALAAGVPLLRLQRRALHPADWGAVSRVLGTLGDAGLWVYDTPMPWPAMAAEIRRRHAQEGLDVVVVDHLQLIVRPPGRATANEALGEIVRGMKHLAQELALPLVVVSQLSRAVEHREDKRPQAYDLRDSGEIEQSANLVLMLWQPTPEDLPDTHGDRRASEMPLECYVAAARSSPAYLGVLLDWDRTTGRMTDGGPSAYQPGRSRRGRREEA